MHRRCGAPITCAPAAAVALGPIAALAFVGERTVELSGWRHVARVGIGADVATVAALTLTVAGARATDGRAVLVGVAFFCI